ncbi:MAG: hypothetical protein JWM37_821 [Candidatus Saccharibacteria bacterium]|nr:hypothetical protein [Candidatus Saccharibacteria bacterium]
MANPTNSGTPGGRRPAKNSFTMKSGNSIKLHRSLGERSKVKRDLRAQRKAMYLSTLPKDRFQRILYRLHPKRVMHYWFSREGMIMALKLAGVGMVAIFLLTVGVFAFFRKDLPEIKNLSGDKLGGSITYYDRTGQTVLFQDYNGVKRVPVAGDSMSKYVKQATIAIEDKDFYKHGAVDLRGIARAGYNDVFGSGGRQGGSTITQQLVKNSEGWTNDQTIARKVKEVILAVELEREYSKDDILTGYLNIAPYGGVAYGVESASRDYFNKSAKELTLDESAFLAALPKAPSSLSPYSDPRWNPAIADSNFDEEALIGRQHYILDQMADQGMIKKSEATAAKKVDILAKIHQLSPSKYENIKAPYFVLAARDELTKKYGDSTVKRGGWKVVTTVDLTAQSTAENLVAKNQATVKRYKGDSQAMVVEDVQTGQIVALVGGSDFNNKEYGELNFAHTVNVSPGSSFKPYDYTAMIENTTNTGAGSVLYDVQQPLGTYKCSNKERPKDGGDCLFDYDFKYPGALTLRYALAGSRNVPAVKAMLTVGTDKVISTANALMGDDNAYKCYAQGVDVNNATKDDQAPCYGSSAIGDGAYLHLDQHVNGLASLARLGNYIPTSYILKITDASNKKLYEWSQPQAKQIVRPDTAYIVNDMLSDTKATYLSGANKFQNWNGWKFAVKTGTTNDNFDGLMTSWSTKYAVVSWVGYHTRTVALTSGAMETMTAPLTRGMMQALHANTKPTNWAQPSGVKSLPAYVVRTHVGLGSVEPSPTNDLFPSWYQAKSGSTGSQTIDKVSNMLATSCTPEMAKLTASGANDNSFSADIFWPTNRSARSAASTTATSSDNVHQCADSKPSITITAPDNCNANQGGCTITATATAGTHALDSGSFPGTINFIVNGQTVNTQHVTDSPASVSFTYMPTSTGQTTITAQIIDSVLYDSTSSANLFATAQTAATTPSQPQTDNNIVTPRRSGN